MGKEAYEEKISKRLSKWFAMNRVRIVWGILTVIFLHLALYIFLLWAGGKDYANQQLLQWLPEIAFLDLGGALFAFIYIAWYKIPKEVHDEEENLKDQASVQHEVQQKQIIENVDDFSKARRIRFGVSNQGYAIGIKIVNGHTKTFKGKLLLMKKDDKKLGTSLELSVIENDTRISDLEWYPTQSRVLDLATFDESTKTAFIIGKNGKIPITKSREYNLETLLIGSFGEEEINPKTMRWVLTYNKMMSLLQLRKGSKIVKFPISEKEELAYQKINAELIPFNQSEHASLRIKNGEAVDLTECFAMLKVLNHQNYYDGELLDIVNPSGKPLSWHLGGATEEGKKNVPANNNTEDFAINIATLEDNGMQPASLKFLFHGHYPTISEQGCFDIVIEFHGKIDNNKFEPIIFEGRMKFSSEHNTNTGDMITVPPKIYEGKCR